MFQLEESFATLGVDVVVDGRASRLDRFAQNLLQTFVKLLELGTRKG